MLLVHSNDLKHDLEGEMRRVAVFLDVTVPEARRPAESFLFEGTNGPWRDVLTADELLRYAARVAEVLPPAGAAWLERGRAAGDPRTS